MKIILFFTYGISLLDWKNTGLLNREVKFYEELNKKYNISVTFVNNTILSSTCKNSCMQLWHCGE